MPWPHYSPTPGVLPTAAVLLQEIIERAQVSARTTAPPALDPDAVACVAWATVCMQAHPEFAPGWTDADHYAHVQIAYGEFLLGVAVSDFGPTLPELEHVGSAGGTPETVTRESLGRLDAAIERWDKTLKKGKFESGVAESIQELIRNAERVREVLRKLGGKGPRPPK